jgi:sulfide dehydrogenase [flavocytochrome c] flavoprotein subunit
VNAPVDGRRRALLELALAGALWPWGTMRAATRPRIIVIGAGFGGATCARYLKLLSPQSQVLMIERRVEFFTGPFTNMAIAGVRSAASIRRETLAIGRAHGVETLLDAVTELDPVHLRVRTEGGRRLSADRIVVAPGIELRWDLIEGLDAARSFMMPHAWLGGEQVLMLRRRLKALPDGATVLIGSPPNPYRCPPGPYERASLMAYALGQSGRARCKILIADAKDDFSQSGPFRFAWDTLYPGCIEWVPRRAGGEVLRVDTATGEVWLRDAHTPVRTQLASIIPPQRAAELARRSDLTDESGWCPIDPNDFQSLRHRGVHVIGDAATAAPMPKSGFAANSQAKLCACAIAAALRGAPVPSARLINTCYSMVAGDQAFSVSGLYGLAGTRLSTLSEGSSAASDGEAQRRSEARQAGAWYAGITTDSFGAAGGVRG